MEAQAKLEWTLFSECQIPKDISNLLVAEEKAEKLINKKEVNYQNKNDLGNIANIFIVIILSIAYIVVGILLIRAVFALQLFTASILASLLSSYLVPGIRNRFEQARNFLKRKFKKRK